MAKFRQKWQSPQVVGKAFEDRVEAWLVEHGVAYTRESMARPQGVNKVGKGRMDFDTEHVCFDCKSVSTAHRMTLPPMKSPCVKTHQLAAMRQAKGEGKQAGLLIEYRHLGSVFWMPIEAIDEVIKDYGLVSSIHPRHCVLYGVLVQSVAEGDLWLERVI